MCPGTWFQNRSVHFLMKSLNRLKITAYQPLSTASNVILLIHIVQAVKQPNARYVDNHNKWYDLVQKRHGSIASAMLWRLFCIKPSIKLYSYFFLILFISDIDGIDEKDVTPLLTHLSRVFLTHRYITRKISKINQWIETLKTGSHTFGAQ